MNPPVANFMSWVKAIKKNDTRDLMNPLSDHLDHYQFILRNRNFFSRKLFFSSFSAFNNDDEHQASIV
jgi:hypothetical protein